MSPVFVAFIRGLVIAAVGGAVTAVTAYTTDHSADLGIYATVALSVWRLAEGAFDKWVRGQQPQDGPTGGRPQNPSAYVFTGPGDLG